MSSSAPSSQSDPASPPPQPSPASPRPAGSPAEVFRAFALLGVTAFGGPIAHIGYFRTAFCERRGWMDDRTFADLLALCQFLPGPASSQMGAAIGLHRAGPLGALAAFTAFTLPSALALALAALGVGLLQGPAAAGLLAGLKLVAVAVVADAVLGMAGPLCPDRTRRSLALATMAAVLAGLSLGLPVALVQLLPLVLAGAAGWGLLAPSPPEAAGDAEAGSAPALHLPYGRRTGLICLAAFALLLLGLPMLAGAVAPADGGLSAMGFADALYRAGALVFGGGHVVLPLLQGAVVSPGWMGPESFLAGYGLAQAVPGPLFTIGAYLGAGVTQSGDMNAGLWPLMALLGTVMIFLPGFLLLFGALPFWAALRDLPRVRGALNGVNAAVVGLLAAALWDPVMATAITDGAEAALAVLAFLALRIWRMPPWLVVAGTALAGLFLL